MIKYSILLILAIFCLNAQEKVKHGRDGKPAIKINKNVTDVKTNVSRLKGEKAEIRNVLMNKGNVELKIFNHGNLGQDGSGSAYYYPKASKVPYRWTSGVMFGAKVKSSDGTIIKSVAIGAAGAGYNSGEREFFPLPGYYGSADELANYDADIDKTSSWPSSWPNGDVEEAVGSEGFPGIAAGGEAKGDMEAYFVMADNVDKSLTGGANFNNPAMGIRMDVHALEFKEQGFDNFIMFRIKATNISTDTLKDCYFGLHDDPDCPGGDGQFSDWTDDYAKFIPVGRDAASIANGLPVFGAKDDVATDGITDVDSLLWNTLYLWDGDKIATGRPGIVPAWNGVKFLKSPTDKNGNQLGLTTLRVFAYSHSIGTDALAYDFLAGTVNSSGEEDNGPAIQKPENITPAKDDIEGLENTYGPDITVVMSSGKFDLAPGESQEIVYAVMMADSRENILNAAMRAQRSFNNDYLIPRPPTAPVVTAEVAESKVKLRWGSISENYFDKVTGQNSFEGYKVFRSDDNGATWSKDGKDILDSKGNFVEYLDLATYDLDNDVSGTDNSRPQFYLGGNTGLKHSFEDKNLINGKEYLYAVVAYSRPQSGGIRPLMNGVNENPEIATHIVRVTPRKKVSTQTVRIAGVEKLAGTSDATTDTVITMLSIDQPTLVAHDSYRIKFKDVNSEVRYAIYGTKSSSESILTDGTGENLDNIKLYDPALDNFTYFEGITFKPKNGGLFTTDDVFNIQMNIVGNIPKYSDSDNKISVVPNPFVVNTEYNPVTTHLHEKSLRIINLPKHCTVRIFTIDGNLIRTIRFTGDEEGFNNMLDWDLLTYNGQEVAYGVYLYQVESSLMDKTHIGKIAIIK